jgi:hypothetical protein
MLGASEWRIRAGFSDLIIRVNRSAPSSDEPSREAKDALRALLYHFRNSQSPVERHLLDVHSAVNGGVLLTSPSVTALPIEAHKFECIERDLQFALECGTLSVSIVRGPDPLETRALELPQMPELPKGHPARQEETFIGVVVVDQDGDPVPNTRVRFRLPNGVVREGTTDSDGAVKIDNLTGRGEAEITLLDFAEPGQTKGLESKPVEPKAFLFIELADDAGRPVPNETYEVRTKDGETITGQLDRFGKAVVEGISAGECDVTFPNLAGQEWELAV